MRLLRSERASAALLLVAAAAGLVVAALPVGAAVLGARDLTVHLGGFDTTPGTIVSDGLLAIFFLLVAVELRRELTVGELANRSAALVPAIAALGGVAAPALVYLAIAGRTQPTGWPIPTPTDIAFALGLLGLLGRGLAPRVRAFLLALAVLDDLVAIVLIAVVFARGVSLGWLLASVIALGAFRLVAGLWVGRRALLLAVLIVLGVAVVYLVARSGIHPTIAGVALGLVLPPRFAAPLDRVLQPVSRGLVLPLFAFSATLVPLRIGTLPLAFVAIAVALPLGKILGITLAGGVATAIARRRGAPNLLRPRELLAVGALGGIGFTVSLLMARLAFGASESLADASTLGVLAGSVLAIALSAVVVPLARRG